MMDVTNETRQTVRLSGGLNAGYGWPAGNRNYSDSTPSGGNCQSTTADELRRHVAGLLREAAVWLDIADTLEEGHHVE